MKFFDKFFSNNGSNSDGSSNEQDMTGGAADINNSDLNDDDLFLDIESWGERISKSSS